VYSFFNHQTAVVSSALFNPKTMDPPDHWAKDVEIWVSVDSATSGFTKAGAATIRPEPVDQTITFEPVEARYLKLKVLSANGTPGYVELGKFRAFEGQRPGYVPLAQRNPDVGAVLSGQPFTAVRPSSGAPAGSDAIAGASSLPRRPPTYAESRHVLVIGGRDYPPVSYSDVHYQTGWDASLYKRIQLTTVHAEHAAPVMLLPGEGIDTVVISQVCNIKTSVSEAFKQALAPWVAQGHKLILQDADSCGGEGPDYSFLPYRFVTSNPGRLGAPSSNLIFVEENTLGNSDPDDRAFIDIKSWLASTNHNNNELGDSNTVKQYDPHWCGHMFGTNANGVSGFIEVYAHLGRGLIIYDGFDRDQVLGTAYRTLVTSELAHPFDPDGLPCTAPLGDFLLTTDDQLKTQWMTPGRTYAYPITLRSNQGYKGDVKLTAAVTPPDPTVTTAFDADTIALKDTAQAGLTVKTTPQSPRTSHTVTVTGKDGIGTTNTLTLLLNERRTGGLRVVGAIAQPEKPTRNLEIILDLSGSMKLPLGKSTRIATARQVLRDVLEKIPDDFNVGLRFYGHRFGSRQKETCTDTELVLPIQKLDRQRVLSIVDQARPRGETPLVYSVLQTPADLKAVGGGSVILITDGEESCNGDPKAAVEQLKASGINVTLNIVGFTLTGQEVQRQLGALAEGTGGRYYSAQNGQALARAVTIAAVGHIPFAVIDSAGHEQGKGRTDGPAVELQPGEYRVVMHVADQDLVAEHVTVTAGSEKALRLVLQGDRLAIQP
jgi:hypothetical protein